MAVVKKTISSIAIFIPWRERHPFAVSAAAGISAALVTATVLAR
jgi:hypothetical protein